jgi:hypothetical protein
VVGWPQVHFSENTSMRGGGNGSELVKQEWDSEGDPDGLLRFLRSGARRVT